jgi:hypothetical protein
VKTYHSQAGDHFSIGNFADLVKRKWGHLGVYLDRPEPRSDRCYLGPDRWRLRGSHLIVAELVGGLIPEARRGSPCTWDMAWIAEGPEDFLPATQRIPPKRCLSVGFVGDGIDARKAPIVAVGGGGAGTGTLNSEAQAEASPITFCGKWSEADKATMAEWLSQHYPEVLS